MSHASHQILRAGGAHVVATVIVPLGSKIVPPQDDTPQHVRGELMVNGTAIPFLFFGDGIANIPKARHYKEVTGSVFVFEDETDGLQIVVNRIAHAMPTHQLVTHSSKKLYRRRPWTIETVERSGFAGVIELRRIPSERESSRYKREQRMLRVTLNAHGGP